MNADAFAAALVFAGVFLVVFGSLYVSAARSQRRGEMSAEGTEMLRWALLGYLVIYGLLAAAAFLV